MHSGNYIFVLHTHLPWVLHHGTWPHGVDWLNEAVAECYLPLMNVFNDLMSENIFPKVTIDISPVLCEQLAHEDFPDIFIEYCDEKISWAKKDEEQFKSWGYDLHHIYLTQFWQNWYADRKNDFVQRYDKSIIKGLKSLQDSGAIEIATCAATHGYLPLLGFDKSINLQIRTAVENYKKHFGRQPKGIWLPECAYRPSYDWKSLIPVAPFHESRLRPGIEQFLAKNGLQYFFTDQNLIDRAQPLGVFLDANHEKFVAIHSTNYKAGSGAFEDKNLNVVNVSSSVKTEYGTSMVFSRHRDIAMQVWSGTIGYPAEPNYLDFHKKHYGSMLRYWRVTDAKADMMYKMLYHPDWVFEKIDLQVNHFIHHIENTLNYHHNRTGKFGTLCTPFDTELFGHWWFEGPEFIRSLIRGLNYSPYVKTATASEQIFRIKPEAVVMLPEGSWGENNNHDVWSNNETLWTWEAIYNDELRLHNLTEKRFAFLTDERMNKILTQALRELMLLQSSDWQFLIHTASAKDYAEQRFAFHHSDFNRLCDIAEKYADTNLIDEADQKYIDETIKRNSPFKELKLEWWSE